MCCKQTVYPWNKRIHKPPAVVVAHSAEGNVVGKSGSGVTVVNGEEGMSSLPVEVESLGFDGMRDSDAMFRYVYGVDERDDVKDGEWVLAGANLSGVVGDLLPAIAGGLVTAPVAVKGSDVTPEASLRW